MVKYLVKYIRNILFRSGFSYIAKFRSVQCGNQTVVPNQSHALIRYLRVGVSKMVTPTTY